MAEPALTDMPKVNPTPRLMRRALGPLTRSDMLRLSPTQRILAWRLLDLRLITGDEYVDALYADREDGGPLDPKSHIQTQMFRLRRKLEPFGVDIVVRRCEGWHINPDQADLLHGLLAAELVLMHSFANPSHHALRYDGRRLLELSPA